MSKIPYAIVPPYLLAHIAAAAEPRFPKAAQAARATLAVDPVLNAGRSRLRLSIDGDTLVAENAPAPDRTISDAEQLEDLPGVVVREEDDGPVGDAAVNEAFDGLGATYDLFWDGYVRDSIDGEGAPMNATVHYGQDYDNAFWDGERMVFGDGDGEVFRGFTGSLSVIAHELSHGVIEREGGLTYEGQSGALNESIADVFGALTEQYLLGQDVEQASWLIGEGIFTDAVEGKALRSMRAPGTAYDDDVLGRDPQPAHMDGYVRTTDDNGGVHINSGIPNRAFYLTAEALGGNAWERAGLIWYRALTSGLPSDATFSVFADATVAAAAAEYGGDSEETRAVRAGWIGVGVIEDELSEA
ncbi:M4 family metallopeptidase [Micromonospora sp. DT81.3]|uniref:M4 family metallopeptidase n=1 Tax=Micromonospora sp. DT81.3 TaxID=3416523 RepID=UPI003CEAE0BF